MRRIAAFFVLFVLVAALAIPSALLITEPGTRWLARRVEQVLPLTLEGVHGSLISGIEVAALEYRAANIDLEIAALRVDVKLRCLLRSVVCLDSLSADSVTLDTAPAADAPGPSRPPWELLADLPSIEVGEASIERASWSAGARREAVRAVGLRGAVGGEALTIERLALCHERGCIDLQGEIDTLGRWRVDAAIELSRSPVEAEGLVVPLAYRLRGDGDTLAAGVRIDADAAGVSLTGELTYAEFELAAGSFRVEGVEEVLPLLAEQDVYPLAGPLEFDVRRRRNAVFPVVRLRQDLFGPAQEILPLAVQLDPGREGVAIEDLSLGAAATPRLRASGFLAYDAAARSRVSLDLARWRPPATLELPQAEASGSLTLRFTIAEPLVNWSGIASRLVLREGNRLWQAEGELRASDSDPFPVGTLAVVLRSPALDAERPLKLLYERAGADVPARIRTTGPVDAGDLGITDLDAQIVPGTPLQLDVAVDGDIATTLSATLDLGDSGAQVRIAPFELAYAGERFNVRDGLALGWDPATRALDLAALCVAWQGSAVCTEGGPVGADGELALRVAVDEAHDGFLGDKPYAIAAQGQGRALLRWSAWQPEAARLDFAFDELTLDPFVGSATARPVRWEMATLYGELDALGVARIEAMLTSQRFGELAADLSLRDGAVEGRLRSSSLSLAAFRDLVPRWRIEAGTIEGDLRIDGPLDAPSIAGDLALREGRLRIPALDLQLESLTLDAQLAGRSMALQGQALAGGGDLRLEAQCCDEERITGLLIGDRNRLQMENGLDATISPSLDFSLSARQLTSSGSLTVHSGVFEHSGLVEGGVAVSPDVRRVDVPDGAPTRFGLDLDLRTLIQPGFTLRSKRFVATLAGDLRLLVPTNQPPSLFGNLDVLGGELRAFGQALRLTDGDLGFVGDPLNPDLAISAEREIRAANQRVGFRVSGTLEEPRFDLFSDPQRSDNETLSYLIRGRAPDVGVGGEGTAMALSLGASALNRSGVLAPLNELPGLSGVTLGAEGSDEEMAATISAYVGNRLYLSYGVGIYEPINALTARLYLRSRLWLEVVSRLENSFDLYYRFDLD